MSWGALSSSFPQGCIASAVPCDHGTGGAVIRGGGLTVSGTNTPDCGGHLTSVGWTGEHRRPRVKAIVSKTAARQTGQALHNTTKTVTEKEGAP